MTGLPTRERPTPEQAVVLYRCWQGLNALEVLQGLVEDQKVVEWTGGDDDLLDKDDLLFWIKNQSKEFWAVINALPERQ